MKFGLAIIIILSFLGIAVLGSLAMSHGDMHYGDCVAATANNMDCPMNLNPVAYLDFHLSFLKVFSTAVFGTNILVISTLLIGLILMIGFVFTDNIFKSQSVCNRYKKFGEHFVSPFELNIRHWLSFHENSPAIL